MHFGTCKQINKEACTSVLAIAVRVVDTTITSLLVRYCILDVIPFDWIKVAGSLAVW